MMPGDVFSIWEMHVRGRSSQPYSSLSREYTVKPGSLNSILAEAGPVYLLPASSGDKRARLLKSEMDIVGIYNIAFRARIADQADAVFFISEVSPLKARCEPLG